jgi:hypothetical protein
LMAMAKDTGGIRPIVVGEVFLWLITCSIVLQLWGPFQEHLSSHQFGISTPRGYEAIPFGIRTFLNLHPDWAMMQVNAFNNFFKLLFLESYVMFKGLWQRLSPYKVFYGVHSSLYYQHGWHVEGVTIIESSSGMKQGDLLRGSLFFLAHYWAPIRNHRTSP